MNEQRNIFIESIYTSYYDLLKRKCYHYIHYNSALMPDVEDCIQNTFMLALSKFDQTSTHSNIAGWLVLTCINQLKNTIKKKRHIVLVESHSSPSAQDTSDLIELWANRHTLDSIYKLLTKNEKAVYDSYFISDLSISETAHKNNKNEGAVKSIVFRIRAKARQSRITYSLLAITSISVMSYMQQFVS